MKLSMFILIMVAVVVGYLMILAAKWTAPLSGAAGFFITIMGLYGHSLRMMGFGAGLFVFSAFLFIKGASQAF